MGLAPQTGIAHTGLPFASTACSEYNGQEVGVMHACGHDAHMSIGEAAGAGIEFEINRGVKAYGHMVVDFLKSQ
jgi:metal-dependent amidase/aminoacylase/carboxypeptidase family protein